MRTTAIWSSTRSLLRTLSAVAPSKVSAQSPPWSRNALPCATSAELAPSARRTPRRTPAAACGAGGPTAASTAAAVGVRRLLGRPQRVQRLEVGDGGRAVGSWMVTPQGYGVHPLGPRRRRHPVRSRGVVRRARLRGHEHLAADVSWRPPSAARSPSPLEEVDPPGSRAARGARRGARERGQPGRREGVPRPGGPLRSCRSCSASRRAGVVAAIGEGAADDQGALAVGDEVIVVPDPWAPTPPTSWCRTRHPHPQAGRARAGPRPPACCWPAPPPSTRWRRPAYGEGDTVLVHGASGGVGLYAVQLARLRGARVIATAGERNHDLLRELGAEPVVVRRRAARPGACARPRRRGRRPRPDRQRRGHGRLAGPGRTATGSRRSPTSRAVRGGRQAARRRSRCGAGDELRAAARPELARLAGTGAAAGCSWRRRTPSTSAADAHRQIATGHTTGKIALLP